jgi:hypothetical protein
MSTIKDPPIVTRIGIGSAVTEEAGPVIALVFYGDALGAEMEIATVAIPLEQVMPLSEALDEERFRLSRARAASPKSPAGG